MGSKTLGKIEWFSSTMHEACDPKMVNLTAKVKQGTSEILQEEKEQ